MEMESRGDDGGGLKGFKIRFKGSTWQFKKSGMERRLWLQQLEGQMAEKVVFPRLRGQIENFKEDLDSERRPTGASMGF